MNNNAVKNSKTHQDVNGHLECVLKCTTESSCTAGEYVAGTASCYLITSSQNPPGVPVHDLESTHIFWKDVETGTWNCTPSDLGKL